MIRLGSFEFRSAGELIAWVLGTVSFLYVVVFELLLDTGSALPAIVRVPLNVAGLLVLAALCIAAVVVVVAKLIEEPERVAGELVALEPLLDAKAGRLAPNLDEARRREVVDALRAQSGSARIRVAHAFVDRGEETAQVVLLEGPDPRALARAWEALSDGARVLTPEAVLERYGLEASGPVVEVVWD